MYVCNFHFMNERECIFFTHYDIFPGQMNYNLIGILQSSRNTGMTQLLLRSWSWTSLNLNDCMIAWSASYLHHWLMLFQSGTKVKSGAGICYMSISILHSWNKLCITNMLIPCCIACFTCLPFYFSGCIADRDFTPGVSVLDNIVRAIGQILQFNRNFTIFQDHWDDTAAITILTLNFV
jgi:hypothetical protein